MDKLSRFLLSTGLVIVVAGISLGIFIGNKVVEMNGPYGMDKITVRAKENTQRTAFTLNDIADMKNRLDSNEIAISSTAVSSVGYENRTAFTKIRGVNYIYSNFNEIGIKFGNFFSAKSELNNEPVILIDSQLALKLFNTDDTVGKKVTLFGKEFTVIGTFQPHGSLDRNGIANKNILERYVDDGVPTAYIPIEVLMDDVDVPGIDFLQIHIRSQGTLGEEIDNVEAAIASVGKPADNYEITDFTQKQALLKQLPRLCIFLIACFPAVLLFRWYRTEFKALFSEIGQQIKKDYFTAVIKKNSGRLAKIVLLVIGSCIFVAVLWKEIDFVLYVPPEYIAEELTDTRYYTDLFQDKMIHINQDASLIPDSSEELMRAGIRANILIACIVIAIGMPMLHFGYRLLVFNKDSWRKQGLYCGGSILAAFVLAAWISWYMGMSFVPDFRLLAVSTLFMVSATFSSRYHSVRKEERGVSL